MATQKNSFTLTVHRLWSQMKRKKTQDPDHITIPYIQGVSKAVTRILAGINIKVYMQPSNTLRRLLSYPKDRISSEDNSNVVYKVVVVTVMPAGWTLKTRVLEHKKAVERAEFSSSALVEHAWKYNHRIDWANARILGVESKYHSRLSREAIHIRRWKTSLNRDRGTLPDIYDCIIK